MKNNQKPIQYRIGQFYAIRSITGLSISPDGKKIAYIVNTNGLPNVWTIRLEGGWTTQITLLDDAARGIKYAPKKNDIIVMSDIKGDENMQLYHISDKGGELRYITSGHTGSQVIFCSWNKYGNKILFASNRRDKRFFDSYIFNFENEKEECVFQSDDIQTYIPVSWSKDERYIALIKAYSNSNQDIFLYDTSSKMNINITEHKGTMKNFFPLFDRKAETVYFVSDYEREFTGLAYYKIKSGEVGWLIKEKWDIDYFELSRKEKFLIYEVNENGRSKLKLYSFKKKSKKNLKIPPGNILGFEITPDDKKAVLVHDRPDNPNDIYTYDIKKEKLRQITFSMIGGIPRKDFVIPKNITFKSFDGLEISAFLYIPTWMKKDGSNPAVLWPHGGPEWQERNLFNKYLQILANRGYIVIAPNFRGSTGYGKSFQKLIYKDWGGNEFKDVLGAYDYLVDSGYADKNKIAVVGGSFGGFMTLTCVTKAPERWKCAVDIFGPSNLVTFLNSVPEHWKPGVNDLVGDPEIDANMLHDRSPINFVDNIKCPMLIIQGKNDPRVVQTESDQMVEKLRSQNKDVEYLILEDEGHGFSKVANQIKVWEMISNFLEKHLVNNK